jgi:hypothetical protein
LRRGKIVEVRNEYSLQTSITSRRLVSLSA